VTERGRGRSLRVRVHAVAGPLLSLSAEEARGVEASGPDPGPARRETRPLLRASYVNSNPGRRPTNRVSACRPEGGTKDGRPAGRPGSSWTELLSRTREVVRTDGPRENFPGSARANSRITRRFLIRGGAGREERPTSDHGKENIAVIFLGRRASGTFAGLEPHRRRGRAFPDPAAVQTVAPHGDP